MKKKFLLLLPFLFRLLISAQPIESNVKKVVRLPNWYTLAGEGGEKEEGMEKFSLFLLPSSVRNLFPLPSTT